MILKIPNGYCVFEDSPSGYDEKVREVSRRSTVETTSFATPTLDSPPLISMYYLPYKNEEVKKFVLY